MSVLLDTSVLFAFLYEKDSQHAEAMDLMKNVWAGRHGRPVVSTWVCDELFTLLRARTKNASLERTAAALLLGPDAALHGVQILPVGPERLPQVWEVFDRHRDRRLSATDASHIVLAAEYGIGAVAVFDGGLDGLLQVVPDRPS